MLLQKPTLNQPYGFQGEDAQPILIGEHRRDPQNSYGSLKMGNGIILSDENNYILAKKIADSTQSVYLPIKMVNLPDSELHNQTFEIPKVDKAMIILSTCKPVNDNLFKLLFLTHSLKKLGIKKVIAFVPYFGYSRQDKELTLEFVAELIMDSGIDHIISVDIHSNSLKDILKNSFTNINLFNIFAPYIRKIEKPIVVTPDNGGLTRATMLANEMNLDSAKISKLRIAPGISQATSVSLDVENRNCVIIDDIIDSANTLCGAAELLIKHGAKSVEAFVTHGVLSAGAEERINKSYINKLYLSNTIIKESSCPKISIIDADDFLSEEIRNLKF